MGLVRSRLIASLLVPLLQSCGGGGGGGETEPGAQAGISVSPSSVSAAATPGDAAPNRGVTVTISNNTLPILYYAIDHSRNGLDRVLFTQTGPTQADVRFIFQPAGALANGTYSDSLELRICVDIECRTDIRGSPKTIRSTYVVSGTGPTSAAVSRSAIELTVDQREALGRREELTATVNAVPPSGIYVRVDHTSNAVNSGALGAAGVVTNMSIGFVAGADRALGTYRDTVTVRVCYDQSCVRQAAGSPFTIPTTFNVTLGVEPGLPQLQVLSRTALGHDVVDAEYSAALNAIVMVASEPQNAIHVFDMDTGIESAQALTRAPTALSVSPDGLTAAVGHDALISVVDLSRVGDAGAPAPAVVNVSVPVSDIALDASGNVYALTTGLARRFIHAVNIATNTEQLVEGFVERIRVHPGTPSLYGRSDLGPAMLSKFDISSGIPGKLYDWPYERQRDACRDFWFSQPGDRIFSGCGATFDANADPALDLIFAGTIPLTQPADRDNNYIESLSHSQSENEIALVEWHHFDCRIGPLYRPCFTRLAYHDDAAFGRTALYGIGPVTIGNSSYAQRGRYVFHDAQSTSKYLISELEGAAPSGQKYWISLIQ